MNISGTTPDQAITTDSGPMEAPLLAKSDPDIPPILNEAIKKSTSGLKSEPQEMSLPSRELTKSNSAQLNSPHIPQSPVDLSDIIAQTDVELRRLGWTSTQGREYLEQTYGKRSRQQLSDEELLAFLLYLESQPSPIESQI